MLFLRGGISNIFRNVSEIKQNYFYMVDVDRLIFTLPSIFD